MITDSQTPDPSWRRRAKVTRYGDHWEVWCFHGDRAFVLDPMEGWIDTDTWSDEQARSCGRFLSEDDAVATLALIRQGPLDPPRDPYAHGAHP